MNTDESPTRKQIVNANVRLISKEGFGASVERVAEGAAVDPELVTRYFPRREELNAATILALFDAYERAARDAPVFEGDIDEWIDEVSAYAHKHNLELFGEAFWEVALSTDELTGGLVDIVAERRWLRGRWSRLFALTVWRATRQNDMPPSALVEAFDVLMNAFSTNGMLAIGYSVDDAATVTAEVLKAVLRAELTSESVRSDV